MSNVLVKRVIGAYLALVAVVVLAQFVAWPLYVDDYADAANDTWLTLNWFMAAGLVLMVVITTRAKRSCDADADNRHSGSGRT